MKAGYVLLLFVVGLIGIPVVLIGCFAHSGGVAVPVDFSNGFAGPSTTDDSFGYLGGKYVKIPAAAASELNLVAGAEVVSKGHRSVVGDRSLAAKAGLHVATGSRTLNGHIYPTGGDVITAVNGHKIMSYGELRDAIRAKEPYDTVTITYFRPSWTRRGMSRTVSVELGYGGSDYSYELP